MLNISDNAQEQKIVPLFRLGFRPMFLFGAAFSSFSILIWSLNFYEVIQITPFRDMLWWHGHEMIFGFASAIIVGFLLTAVQNWTGCKGVKGWSLAGLFLIWFLARLLLLLNFESMITIAIDLVFLPISAILLALPIIKIKQYRNLFFVPLLLLLTLANGLTYVETIAENVSGFHIGTYGATMLITTLMTIMGGRVIPFFTATGTGTKKVKPLKTVEFISLFSCWLISLVFLSGAYLNPNLFPPIALLFFVAAVSNGIRFLRWRFWITGNVPLLWSLHFAYLFIVIGCFLMSIHFWNQYVPIQTALHSFTAGAMGTMIIAMIARVSLGHTGRPLNPHKLMSVAFIGIILAASIRVCSSILFLDHYKMAIGVSGWLWFIGFGLFALIYFPILTQSRSDGRPG